MGAAEVNMAMMTGGSNMAVPRRMARIISGMNDRGTCKVSGGGAGGGGVAVTTPTDKQLQDSGFKRVNDSPLYVPKSFQGFAFWREDDGGTTPLVTFNSRTRFPIPPAYVFGVDKSRSGIRFHTLDRQTYSSFSFGSMYLSADWDYDRDIGEQLVDAGFACVAPEVFRWVSARDDHDYSIVVRVLPLEHKRIVTHVLESLGYHTRKQVRGLEPVAARQDGEIIVLGDDVREVELSPSNIIGVRFKREPTMEELGVPTIEERIAEKRSERDRAPGQDFVVGDVNDTEAIMQLSYINGISIRALEKRLRPRGSSVDGFLGPHESLLDVMARDNDFVRSQGLTHQEIARHMHNLDRVAIKHGYSDDANKIEIPYGGRRFHVSTAATCGSQHSPFDDGLTGSGSVSVTNLDTGLTLKYGDMLPGLIYRYGFYEGLDTPWRVDPARVLEVLDFLNSDRG